MSRKLLAARAKNPVSYHQFVQQSNEKQRIEDRRAELGPRIPDKRIDNGRNNVIDKFIDRFEKDKEE